MFFYPLYYDTISLISLKITQAFHLLLGFAENPMISWYFKIQNSVRIIEGLDSGDSDNRGPTVMTSCPILLRKSPDDKLFINFA